jgi:hypothetical protein
MASISIGFYSFEIGMSIRIVRELKEGMRNDERFEKK